MPSYTREDFEPVVCEKCGRDQGMFVIAESESERTVILCSECRYEYLTSDELDFNQALESSVNWEDGGFDRSGRIMLKCVHCGEYCDETWREDDRDLATEFLTEDKEHACYSCVICGNGTAGEKTIDGDYYCDECHAEALKEDTGKESEDVADDAAASDPAPGAA